MDRGAVRRGNQLSKESENQTVIRIEPLICEVTELVSFPQVYLRLSELLEEPTATTRDIGKLIAQDPSLTLGVLKLANSPLYGLTRQVETVNHAVTVLGKRQIIELVLATSVGKVIEGIPNDVYDMDDFWRHSIFCGIVTRELARECRHADADSSFVAGLLHDIGQLVLFNRFPGQSRVVLELVMDREVPIPLFLAERKVFGFDHAVLGGRLLERWNLPERLRECVEFHHEPALATGFPVEVALIHIANSLTNTPGTELDPQTAMERIDRVCWSRTGLTPGQVEPLLERARESVDALHALFAG